MGAAEHIATLLPPAEDPRDGDPPSGRLRRLDIGELRTGDLVAGRYVIESLIGCGGHGAIHRALHAELGLPVAIKVVNAEGPNAAHPQVLQRFLREARIAALIRHRNVLSVHDAGRLDDGSPFLVMELIEGEDLEQRIARGPLAISAIVDLGRQLYSGITAIAEAGVLHRDVKPANVMLHREVDGNVLVKLVDFGIARSRHEVERLTLTGAVVGTPHYMSPEQLRGEPLDARADMYSAAAVLYEATTGRPPFDAPATALIIGQILSAPFVPVRTLRPDCPLGLAEVIERGLGRKRSERCSHPMQVVAALDGVARTQSLPSGALAWAGDPGGTITGPLDLSRRRLHTPTPAPDAPPASPEEPVLPPMVDDPEPPKPPHRPDEIQDPPPEILPRRARVARWLAGSVAAAVALALVTGWSSRVTPSAAASVAPVRAATAPAAVEIHAGAPRLAPAAPARADVDGLLQRGLESLARDEIDAALADYRAAAQLDPARPEAQRGRGVAASRAGFDDEAIASFERYLALAPDAMDAERVRDRLGAVRARRTERSSHAAPLPTRRSHARR